ncbi:MAG: hypothetical protein RLZZ153_970, partial [Pseudomonadota bacterium]
GFGPQAVRVSGGFLSDFKQDAQIKTQWSAVFNPAAADARASAVPVAGIEIDAARFTDLAGNANLATPVVKMDAVAPTVTIKNSASALKIGQSATITFDFSEDPRGTFSAADLQVEGGNLGPITGTGLTRSVVFTPSTNTSGQASIAIAAGGFSDWAGNLNARTVSPSMTVDTKPPVVSTVTEASQAAITKDAVNFTVTFSEALIGTVGTGNFTATNGTVTSVTQVDASNAYTVVVTPTANLASGNVALIVVGTGLSDVAGNALASSTDPRSLASQAVDTLAPASPTVALGTGVDGGATRTEAAQSSGVVTITAEAGAPTEVTFTNGEASVKKTVTGAGTTAVPVVLSTAEVTALGEGTVTVSAVATDAAGNVSQDKTHRFVLDATAPTIAIETDKQALKAGETATITFTFSEDPGGTFTSSDVEVIGGELGDMSGSGLTRTATFTPLPDKNAQSASIKVDHLEAADLVKTVTKQNNTTVIDTIAEGVTLTRSNNGGPMISSLYQGEPSITWNSSGWDDLSAVSSRTFTTFALALNNRVGEEILAAKLVAHDVINDKYYTFDFTQYTGGGGGGGFSYTRTLIDNINSEYKDAAGNIGLDTSSLVLSIDTSAPTVSVSSSRDSLGEGETATITFAFSEDPGESFTSADVEVTGGELGEMSGSGLERTAVFTPSPTSENSTASITVVSGSYSDEAGNAGGASNSAEVAVAASLSGINENTPAGGVIFNAASVAPQGTVSYGFRVVDTISYVNPTSTEIPDTPDGNNNNVQFRGMDYVDQIADGVGLTRDLVRPAYSVTVGWNADGWDDLNNLSGRNYVHRMDQATDDYSAVTQWVMHDILQEAYYKVSTSDNFQTYTLLRVDPSDGADWVDPDTDNVAQEQMVDTLAQAEYGVSVGVKLVVDRSQLKALPTIEWNFDGWDDLSDVADRIYAADAFTGDYVGDTNEAVMHDIVHDTYYKVDIAAWSGQTGNYDGSWGGLSYTRSLIEIGDDLSVDLGPISTVEIPDGRVLDTLPNGVQLIRSWGGSLQASPTVAWNAQGWDDLTDVASRAYTTSMASVSVEDGLGNHVLSTEWVMHDKVNDTYYKVDITDWTQDGNGGGFAYQRSLINPSDGTTGTPVVFIHADYSDSVDVIAPGVIITRGESKPLVSSPIRWNADGWDNLENFSSRTFFTSMEAAVDGSLGDKVEDAEWVMQDLSTGKYYKVDVTHWQQGGGGGVAYERSEIVLNDGSLGQSLETPLLTEINDFVIDRLTGEISYGGSPSNWDSSPALNLMLVAEDKAGNRALKALTVYVAENEAPVWNETTITLTAQPSNTLEFDFIRIDSWDRENFQVFIDENQLINLPIWFGQEDGGWGGGHFESVISGQGEGPNSGIRWSITPKDYGDLYDRWAAGSNYDQDQSLRVQIYFPSAFASAKVRLSSTLDSSIGDESWGIDNVSLNAKAVETFDSLTGGWSAGRLDQSPLLGSFLGSYGAGETTEKTFSLQRDYYRASTVLDFSDQNLYDTNYDVQITDISLTDGDLETLNISREQWMEWLHIFDVQKAKFASSGSVQVSFAAPLAILGAGTGTATYTLSLTDEHGASSSTQVSIAIKEIDLQAPVITSGGAVEVPEGFDGTVYTVAATDNSDALLSYAISGDDAALFNIDSASGEVSFKVPPNFEAPNDGDQDNIYKITVKASDGANRAEKDVAITVEDVVPEVVVTVGDVALEGANLVYTFSRSGDIEDALTVNIGYSGTASTGTDYAIDGPFSKSWSRLVGGSVTDTLSSIATTADGGFYAVGQASYYSANNPMISADGQVLQPLGDSDGFIRKFAANGTEEWTRLYGGSTADNVTSVTVDTDGSAYLTGYYYDGGYYNKYITKFTSAGNQDWTFGKDVLPQGTSRASLALPPDNESILFLGGSYFAGNGDSTFLTKITLDNSGPPDTLSTVYLTQRTTQAIAASGNGIIYLTGYTEHAIEGQSYAGGGDAFLSKLNSDGTVAWSRLIGGSSWDSGTSVVVGSDGGVYVAGFVDSSYFVNKFDTNGALVWSTTIANQSNYASSLAIGSDGFVYLSGITTQAIDGQAALGWNDAFVTRIDPDSGQRTFTRIVGSDGDDRATTIAAGPNGEILIGGTAYKSYDAVYDNLPGMGSLDGFVTQFAPPPLPTTVTFAPGSATATLTPKIKTDEQPEGDETLTLTVLSGEGYSIGSSASATATIEDNVSPVITSATTANVSEGSSGTVYTATATDANVGSTLSYGLAGTDAARFNIDVLTGAVSFRVTPDFEAPADEGTNNIYDITVTASDGVNTSQTRAVAITVLNANDAPVNQYSFLSNLGGLTWTSVNGYAVHSFTAVGTSTFTIETASPVSM